MPTEISAQEAEHRKMVKSRSFTISAERALIMPGVMEKFVRAYRELANQLCPPGAEFFRLGSVRELDIFDNHAGQNVPYNIRGTLIFYS